MSLSTLGAVLTVPTTQTQLARSLIGAGSETAGSVRPAISILPLSVPANGSVQFSNTVPGSPQNVWALIAPLSLVSTLHSPDLLLTATIDAPDNFVAYEVPITKDFASYLTEYAVVRKSLDLLIVNNTATSALVTVEAQYLLLASYVYELVWQPLLASDYYLLTQRAQQMLQGGEAG